MTCEAITELKYFKVFRCRCADWICKCDEQAESVAVASCCATCAADKVGHLFRFNNVVVQDHPDGERVTVVFDEHERPIVT